MNAGRVRAHGEPRESAFMMKRLNAGGQVRALGQMEIGTAIGPQQDQMSIARDTARGRGAKHTLEPCDATKVSRGCV